MAPVDRKGVGGLPAWLLPALPDELASAKPTQHIAFSARSKAKPRRPPGPTGCMAAVKAYLKAQAVGHKVWLKEITAATGHTSQEVGSSLSKLKARGCIKAERDGRANKYRWDDAGTEGRPYRLNK